MKSVGNRFYELSIPPMESSRRDLSIQRVVKAWFLIFGRKRRFFIHFVADFFMKNNELPRQNGSGIGFMRSRSVELEQKFEVFNCYNGLGGSSRGADGLYGGKTWSFWWS